jgi:hypothetical protein
VACRNPLRVYGILKNEAARLPKATWIVCLEIYKPDPNGSKTEVTRNRPTTDSYKEHHTDVGTSNQLLLQEVKQEFPGRNYDTYIPSNVSIYTIRLSNKYKFIIIQQVLGRTNRLLSFMRHGPHWKRRVQKFFYCCLCIRYRGNVSTEPLPSNDKGIFTEPLPSSDKGIFTETLPSNDRGYAYRHTNWWEGFF